MLFERVPDDSSKHLFLVSYRVLLDLFLHGTFDQLFAFLPFQLYLLALYQLGHLCIQVALDHLMVLLLHVQF